jgi:hypothetical protein
MLVPITWDKELRWNSEPHYGWACARACASNDNDPGCSIGVQAIHSHKYDTRDINLFRNTAIIRTK